ncbi:MAG TPA: cobalamin-dependent protein, partial [Negativicutes bacterium]
MNKGIDLLLVNSFAPRYRNVSDAALENSLAIIRTYLEDRGYNIQVIDEQRVTGIEEGVPRWILRLLRRIIQTQLKVHTTDFKFGKIMLVLVSWPLHVATLYFRRKYMAKISGKIVKLVREKQIPMIGIKLWSGDSYKWSALLSHKIRQAIPEAVVVAGGPHVKVYGENVLAQNEFDLAIMGPGEEPLERLLRLRKIAKNKAAFLKLVSQGISPTPLIRSGQFCDESLLPASLATIPRYTQNDLEDKILFHTIVDAVGCTWNKCYFCSHTRQQSQYTPRPIPQIRDEIVAMLQQGIAFFRFSSSETPIYHGKAIAHMLLENKINIRYSMFVRAGQSSQETYDAYRLMIESGLRAVFMGGETAHDLINDKVMNKGVKRKDILETIQCIKLAAANVGVPCQVGLALIYPCPVLPKVNLETIFEENLRLVAEALPDTVIVNPPGIFPGTVWFEQAASFGFKVDEKFTRQLMQYEYSIYKPA